MELKNAPEKALKVVLTGDTNTGKTLIMHRIMGFDEPVCKTIGLDFFSKTVSYKDINVKIAIFDTSGCEKYFSIVEPYFKNGDIFLIVFSIENERSFQLVNIFNDLAMRQSRKAAKILIGNAINSEPLRQISREEGEAKAREINADYMETNCATGGGIDNILDFCCTKMHDKIMNPTNENDNNSANDVDDKNNNDNDDKNKNNYNNKKNKNNQNVKEVCSIH